MTCPHCKCQTYMTICPHCGENTNRANYTGYSKATQRKIAIESLERWQVQMEDLVSTGVFGTHVPEGCTACHAGQMIQAMSDLRRMLQRVGEV